MSQDQETYHRLGRGGAGNYVSSSPLQDEVLKQLNSQNQPSTKTTSQPGYKRYGRGGAGNFLDSALVGDAEIAAETTGTLAKPNSHRMSRMAGRGGAGNWAGAMAIAMEAEERERERSKGKELDRMATEEVDLGLKMPERVHQGPGKTIK